MMDVVAPQRPSDALLKFMAAVLRDALNATGWLSVAAQCQQGDRRAIALVMVMAQAQTPPVILVSCGGEWIKAGGPN